MAAFVCEKVPLAWETGFVCNGGRLEFAYSLDVNTLLASENAVYINVREQPQ